VKKAGVDVSGTLRARLQLWPLTPAEWDGQTESGDLLAMNAYASPDDGFNGFSHRVEEIMESVETEIRHAAAYVDRVIVPEVRREAGTAARVLAGHLDRLADRLHPQDGPDEKRGL
jgi:hypothetical protein